MPGSGDALVVPAEILRALMERARSHPEEEIVGFLSGPEPFVATRDVPLSNASADPSTFVVDPFLQFLAEREIAALGEEIVAIYHSHPAGDATFSDLDAQFASAWSCAHLVIGLDPTPEARAYKVASGARVVEMALTTS